MVCTLGTAFIGVATAVVTFNASTLAQKILSLLVASFGVVLSLLKGSRFLACYYYVCVYAAHGYFIGTGLPASAFGRVNKANDIIVR